MSHPFWQHKTRIFLAALIALLFPGALQAAPTTYSASLGFEYATGKYGTGIRTDSVYAPVTLSVFPSDRLDFSVEVPYVYQSTSSVVAREFMGMRQATTTGTTTAAAAMTGPGAGMGTGPGPRTNASAANADSAESGLGDVILRAGYILFQEGDLLPSVRPNFALKLPTADENKFLGTGAFDESFGLELAKWFGEWLTDVEGGYTFQGHSSVTDVKDYFYYTAGVGYQLTDRLRPMLILKGSTPPVEGAVGKLETRLRLKWQFAEHAGLDGYLAKGLTDSSPDYGTGLAVYYDF